MDERSDRGDFYPGGREGGAPVPGGDTDKVDRVNLGEVGENYTLKDVKNKVNQIVRVIAPAATCLAMCAWAATAPLEDLPNTASVVTNEEDAVAMAAVGALEAATSNQVAELSSAFNAKLAGGTNAVMAAMAERMAAESNRVDATFAKRSEIPAAPDLAPYALKSELPQDYLTENDITNFATRAWIAAQGYGTSADMNARIDAQDLAIDAATNRLWAAHRAEAARLGTASNALAQAVTAAENTARNELRGATNAVWAAHRAEVTALRAADAAISNRVTAAENTARNELRGATNAVWQGMASASNRTTAATNRLWTAMREASNALAQAVTAAENTARNELRGATNKMWQAVRSESNRLDRTAAEIRREIDALELTGGMTRLWSSDATTYQDATGVVWQVQDSLGPWQATTSSVQFVSWEDLSTEEYDLWKLYFSVDGTNAEGYAASQAGLTSYTLSAGEWEYSGLSVYGDFPVTFVRPAIPGGATNAVNRVAYTNDVAAATDGVMGEVDNRFNQWGEMGTVYAATRLVDQTGGGYDDVTASNMWETAATVARKQDALPYPTNAIPYAAIADAPSGGAEWRVVDVHSFDGDVLRFVTNGMTRLYTGDAIALSTNGWPEGAAMFVAGIKEYPTWYPAPEMRLVGREAWPSNDFQSVWWRSGTNIFVNILVEE